MGTTVKSNAPAASAKAPAQTAAPSQPSQDQPDGSDPQLSQVLSSPAMSQDELALTRKGTVTAPTADPAAQSDTGSSAAMANYLAQKVSGASDSLPAGDFLDGIAELNPIHLHNEKNDIKQKYAQIALQVAQQTIDPSDPHAKQKIDKLFAYENAQAQKEIDNLPLYTSERAVGAAASEGAHAVKKGTFTAGAASTGFFGGIFSGIGGFFGGISHWFSSNAN